MPRKGLCSYQRLLVSVAGTFSAGGVGGGGEDIYLFTATSLGDETAGSWSRYFDGSDIALDTATGEEIDGFWVDPARGALYLSSYDFFAAGVGVAGDKNDLYVCAPASLGEDTICTLCPAEGTPGADACLETPGALAAAPDGSVYVGDGCSIRRVAGNGEIPRIAGRRDECAFAGDGGPVQDGLLTWPHALAVGPDGDLYVLDGLYNALPNNVGRRVRRISQDGVIETVAGNGLFGYNGDGLAATQASFTNPNALAVDATGVLYIADTGANRVRRVGRNGEITTVAGTGQTMCSTPTATARR